MESREARWRSQGLILFGFVALLYTCATEEGAATIKAAFLSTCGDAPWIALVGLLVVFFGSEAIGQLINQVTMATICIVSRGTSPGNWYSVEWDRNLSGTPIWSAVQRASRDKPEINKRLESYSADVFLSYFWQQAPESIVRWVSRRHTVYWNAWTTVSAFVLSVITFFFITLCSTRNSNLRPITFILFIAVAAGLCVFCGLHARTARTEAWQMIELWAMHKFGRMPPKGFPRLPDGLINLLDTAAK